MITGLDHIAIIVSSENSVDFYKKLGFSEKSRIDRDYDIIVFLTGFGITLEIFVDPTHPERVTHPEAMGLRHISLKVDNLFSTIKELKLDFETIREINGVHYTFLKDPDGLPIEFHE